MSDETACFGQPGNVVNINKVAANFAAFPNIVVNQKALVSDAAPSITMVCSSADCTDEQTTASKAVANQGNLSKSFSVTVPAVRIDEYMRALTPPVVPYFVKLDLQGLDFDVIQTLVSIFSCLLVCICPLAAVVTHAAVVSRALSIHRFRSLVRPANASWRNINE